MNKNNNNRCNQDFKMNQEGYQEQEVLKILKTIEISQMKKDRQKK